MVNAVGEAVDLLLIALAVFVLLRTMAPVSHAATWHLRMRAPTKPGAACVACIEAAQGACAGADARTAGTPMELGARR